MWISSFIFSNAAYQAEFLLTFFMQIGAYNICRVTADLSTVPESKFMLARSSPHSDEYFIAEFKLEATFVGGMIHWKLIFDGQEYGSVSVSYDRS